MKKLLKKVAGIALMSIPFWISFWVFGEIVGGTLYDGFVMMVMATLFIIGILDGFLLVLTTMDIGWKLYKGESLGENKWLK